MTAVFSSGLTLPEEAMVAGTSALPQGRWNYNCTGTPAEFQRNSWHPARDGNTQGPADSGMPGFLPGDGRQLDVERRWTSRVRFSEKQEADQMCVDLIGWEFWCFLLGSVCTDRAWTHHAGLMVEDVFTPACPAGGKQHTGYSFGWKISRTRKTSVFQQDIPDKWLNDPSNHSCRHTWPWSYLLMDHLLRFHHS